MESSGSEEKAVGQFDFDALERWRSAGGGRGTAEVERWRSSGGRGGAEVERWRREGDRQPFDHLRQLDKCNVNNPFENKHIVMMLKSPPEDGPK